MSLVKFVNGTNDNRRYIEDMYEYISDPIKTADGTLVNSRGCTCKHPISDMMAVKKVYHKTHGKQGEHFVVSLTPEEKLTDELCMQIGTEIADYYKDYQSTFAVHKDTAHTHLHFLLNSVSFMTGKKFSQSPSKLNAFKGFCNKIFQKHDIDIIQMCCHDMVDSKPYTSEDGFDFLEPPEQMPVYQDIELNTDISLDIPAEEDSIFMKEQLQRNQNSIPKEESVPKIQAGSNHKEDMKMNMNQKAQNAFPTFQAQDYPAPIPFGYIPQPMPMGSQPDYTCMTSGNTRAVNLPYPNQMRNTSLAQQVTATEEAVSQQYPTAKSVDRPLFEIDCSRNLVIRADQHTDLDQMQQAVQNFEGVSAQDKTAYTKIGMAAMSKMQQTGYPCDMRVNVSTTVTVDFTQPNQNSSQVIDTDYVPLK